MSTLMYFSTYVDEVPLCAAGLVANHAEAGDKVIAVVMCYPGGLSRIVYPEVTKEHPYGRFKTKENWEREVASKELKTIAEILGIQKTVTLDYTGDQDMLFGHDVVDKVTALLNEYKPDIVVTYWPIGDYTDFIGTGTAVLRAMIDRRLEKMPQVYFAETLTGRHTLCFAPQVYVDISKSMAKKREASKVCWEGKNYDYFFNPFALPVAQFRGRECGVEYAEAFVGLHGSFGLEKRKSREEAHYKTHPVGMRRAVKILDRKEFAEGVYPRSYGCINAKTTFEDGMGFKT